MAAPEVIDADVVEENGAQPTSHALVPREAPQLSVAPQVGAADLVLRLKTIREAMDQAMEANIDYGVIPGTGSKPTLLKPGAEKLIALFQLDIQYDEEETHGPGDHLTVKTKARVYHAITGLRLGAGSGMCSTREKKYAVRKQERVCPQCGAGAVIKGKQEYGGGWLCFAKKGGCNAKWPDGAQEIEGQPQGEIENPDLPDSWNTVIKMAKKRAQVDAVLAVTGASALFTQDIEDTGGDRSSEPESHAQAAPRRTATAKPAEGTERAASPAQRRLILARAMAAELSTVGLANFLLEVAGQERQSDMTEEKAKANVDRNLDRLPARLVDPLLELIKEIEPTA